MKIFPKLFLASSMSFLFVIALVFIFIDQRFGQDLVKYVNRIETAQLKNFASEIEDYYAEVQTWDFLKENPRMADLILQQRRSFDENVIIIPNVIRERRRFRFSFEEEIDRQRAGRLFLLDNKGLVIVGNKKILMGSETDLDLTKDLNDELIKASIMHNNEPVGTLALIKNQRLFEDIDRQFAEANRDTLWFSGLLALIIAAIISLILTHNISGPIRKLARATRSLISGEFKTRVNISNKDELGKLSRDFNILAKTLDKNSESQKQWLADISHELRTPLAILKSELEAIDDGIRKFDEEMLNSLIHEVKRINTLVNDLYELSLSDLGAMKYQMTEIDIKANIESSVESYEERYKKAGIEIISDLEEVDMILGDQHRLTQLFTNLLENTLRYTDDPGQLMINMVSDDDQIIISFIDSPPGVEEETLNKIFDRFFREELSRSREMGGAGLGLSICSEIIEAHSGSIQAKQADIGGLEIIIKLNKGDL